MKRYLITSLVVFVFPIAVFGASIVIAPETPVQGDPLMIQIDGLSGTTTVQSISLAGRALNSFIYERKVTALYGIDLRKAPGIYHVSVKLSDGTTMSREVVIRNKEKYEEVFTIPAKLGGNATSSQKALVSRLALENASLENIWTGKKAFWTLPFRYPLALPIVTDTYGYVRKTGVTTIAHKGADLRAALGTDVYAMNRGVVRMVRNYQDYGRTIVVDHGLGLMTFYMHLSKILVNEGELVLGGQVIGRSGDTGYAEKPHLHLTVRIGGISIDPVRFMELFKSPLSQ
jgi:murein DD-endopeptidase MepM/ murein hydrolase activator NlpD